jgi:hypothetical protein
MTIPYTSSDMWLLVAIAYSTADGPAQLADIIETGDAINKAIFTGQELRRGMARLVTGGIVIDLEGRFDLTERGRKLLEDARAQGATNRLEEWAKLDELLAVDRGPRNHPQFEDPTWSYQSLTEPVIEAAYASYGVAARRVVAKLFGEDV